MYINSRKIQTFGTTYYIDGADGWMTTALASFLQSKHSSFALVMRRKCCAWSLASKKRKKKSSSMYWVTIIFGLVLPSIVSFNYPDEKLKRPLIIGSNLPYSTFFFEKITHIEKRFCILKNLPFWKKNWKQSPILMK